MAVLSELRYSATSLTRTPGVAAALVVTIALGIGSNAAVHGFVRGLIARDMQLPHVDGVVSVLGVDVDGGSGPLAYDDYLSIKGHREAFEWLGAVHESLSAVTLSGRSLILPIAGVTPEVAALFQLSRDERVVISHRMRQTEFGATADVRAATFEIDGVDARVTGVAPDWLDGLYIGRPVDIWRRLDETSLQETARVRRAVWVLGRLRAGVSADRAEDLINAGGDAAGIVRVLPYTGMTPDMAAGLSRIGVLLRAAAAAVFFIACANVAALLLSRASGRSQETSVRVALGARRAQLARQLLWDSLLISLTGGVLGLLLAMWTSNIVPALFFDKDAAELVFAPDLSAIVTTSTLCLVITMACGIVPLFEIRDDRPAAVLQRESTGPAPTMRRLRTGLVVAQMALCCILVIATGFLLESFRSALTTNVGGRLGEPILATLRARPGTSRSETVSAGLAFFRDVETAAASVTGVTPRAWVATLPGGLPSWQQVRVEASRLPLRDVTLDLVPFTPESIAHILVPPVAGRLFGGQDTPQACRVAIVNEEAAREVFNGDAIGRSVDGPTGQHMEIIGVVGTRVAEGASDRIRPTIYYYAEQVRTPLDPSRSALFRVSAQLPRANVMLDSNVVSAGYFGAMGWPLVAGSLFSDQQVPGGCRVGVVNEQAAELYFGGNAIGAAVIDGLGRRTEIIGVVRAAPLRTLQSRVEPAIYFPMAQDFLPSMTLILEARDVTDAVLADVYRRLDAVPGRGPAPVVIRTLDSHLSRTALAPLRIATTLVGTSAATALALGMLGLYGAMADAARQRRREIAVRIALGAPGWRVIRQVVAEGARLAMLGTIAGMLGSLLVAGSLARVTPNSGSVGIWVWLAAPLVLMVAVAVASVLPAHRALTVDPLAAMRTGH